MKILSKIFVLLSMVVLAGCSGRLVHKSELGRLDSREILLEQIESTAELKGTQYEIVEHTLKNGLKVLVVDKPTMSVVSVQVWYNVGSKNETDGFKGIAHLFEHMMFRGSDNFGPQEHSRLVKEAGGRCNAYTSDEVTVYHQKVPADKLGLVLRLESDRMASLKLNQEILDTEREVVMEEYRLRVDNNPIGSLEKKLRRFLFPDHPYEFGPIGRMEDIAAFSVEDCQGFFESYYASNNAVLIVAGDVRASEVIDLVESEFGSIVARPVGPAAELSLDISRVDLRNKAQSQLPIPVTVVALYTADERDEDSVVLKLIINSLAKGRSSRLWKKLVREKKLAEFFVGEHIQGQENGVVFLAGAHLPYLSGKVKSTILAELEKIKSDGLEKDEFIKTRNWLYSQMMFQRYYVNSLAGGIGYCEVVRGDYRLFHQMPEKIEAVTQADIIRVANKYFTEDNIRVIYLEPKEGIFLAGLAGFIKSIFY